MKLSDQLLEWYDHNRRNLPWRDVNDPYKTWLSEIMLQQTRSETVIRYYDRFLSRYPNVFALAAAPIDDVLKLWEGLGYYSRARNLHACAITVIGMDGKFPETAHDLEQLPGIGPYVSRAIASIAFNEAVPALDGNQMRVYSRLFAVDRVLKTPFDLEELALREMSVTRPGDFNQALMDLGASICTPKNPSCAQCPFVSDCKSFTEGQPERYPMRPAPIPKKDIDRTILIIQTPEGIYVRRRTEKLLGGLYEFPAIEHRASIEEVRQYLECNNSQGIVDVTPLRDAKHVFTHLIWHMTGYLIRCDSVDIEHETAGADDLSRLAFPSAVRVYRKIAMEAAESQL